MNKKEKVLYFLGMGCDYSEEKDPAMKGSDVGNYRIRTTFHNKNGDIIFLEVGNGCQYNNKFVKISDIALRVDHQYNKTISNDENESHIKIDRDILKKYKYTKKDVINYINEVFGVLFDDIIILDRFSEFDYHKETGDTFKPNFEKIEQAKKIDKYFYNFEKNTLKKQYPNHSTYFEDGKLKVLLHYNCYNDIVFIDDVFSYNFDYKAPEKGFLQQKADQYWANFKGC